MISWTSFLLSTYTVDSCLRRCIDSFIMIFFQKVLRFLVEAESTDDTCRLYLLSQGRLCLWHMDSEFEYTVSIRSLLRQIAAR